MNKRKKFFNFNSQHGGMLLELMLSVAIAAILIPFVFRYQKITAERAQNVAIAKQMGVVQLALERCISENQNVFFNHVGEHIFANAGTDPCINLGDLVGFGVDENFANDFHDDYILRVLKSQDNNGAATLQGVVLLTDNSNLTTLRTREVVNVGVGKIGYIGKDKNNKNTIYGGFNSFDTGAEKFGLGDYSEGVVKTTAIMRGNTKYLWRVRLDGEVGNSNAKMKSPLNLGYQNITDVNNLNSSKGTFSELHTGEGINTRTLKFTNRAYFSSNLDFVSKNVQIKNANMFLNGGTLNISDGLTVTDRADFYDFTTTNLTKTGNATFLESPDGKISGTKFITKGTMSTKALKANNMAALEEVETTNLTVKYIQSATYPDEYYWNVTNSSTSDGASFYNIDITTLPWFIGALKTIYTNEEYAFCSSAGPAGNNHNCDNSHQYNNTKCAEGNNCVSSVNKMSNYLANVRVERFNIEDFKMLLQALLDIQQNVETRYQAAGGL